MASSYAEVYARSLGNPQAFWALAARDVEWVRRPRAVLNDTDVRRASWFPGGMLNTCYNALDLHVASGRGEQAALIHESPVTRASRTYSYREVLDRVARIAGMLRGLGVEKGDRVLLYMPMLPEAVFGMLAAARIGAIHSVVFGGFASGELAQRIQHAAPKVVLTASCGIEPTHRVEYKPLLDAVDMPHAPLERHRVPAVVAHDALRHARGARGVEDVEGILRFDRQAAGRLRARLERLPVRVPVA
ncbi:MAG TPA: AMP-binding protein, partial [Myxococcota bacterium]